MSLFKRKPLEPENFIVVYTPPPPPTPPNRRPEDYKLGTIVEVDGVLWTRDSFYYADVGGPMWKVYTGEIPGTKKSRR